MTISEEVMDKLRALSSEDQRKVLEFVATLPLQEASAWRRKDPKGMYADRGVDLSAEEIDEARREAWANFPRDLPQGNES